MKIDKRLLVAGLTMLVVVLGVSASSASAAVWKDKGTNVTKFVEFATTGGEVAELGAKGVSCTVAATFTTEGGSTGKVSKYTLSSCKTFGELSGCTVATAEAKGLPWTVDVNTTNLTITNMRVRRTFAGGCAEIDKTVTSTKVTLLSPTAITEMEFLGEIIGTYKTFGSLTVSAPNAGTYGIG